MPRRLQTALLVAASFLGAVGLAAQPEGNTIELQNCDLTLPGTTLTAPARCGTYSVAENPLDPTGRQIVLRLAVVPAARRDARPDPLFIFAGGPGQAATEAYVMMRWALSEIRADRDIVLLDQRGTGGSAAMDCGSEEDAAFEFVVNEEQIREHVTRCLNELDADPRYYTTSIAMGDYDAVRRALGYEQINLFGVSYGTRAAQVYYRLFPQTVRSMILDSSVPMRLRLGTEHAPMLDRTVEAILADCRAQDDCAESFPVDMEALRSLISDLRETPRTTELPHPSTGEMVSVPVNGDTLAAAIRFLSYSAPTQAAMPLLLHEATADASLERLTSQAMMIFASLSQMISQGMELSVMCSEDLRSPPDNLDYSDTLLGNTMLEAAAVSCSIWPKGEVPQDFHDPVGGDIPLLLMSGSRDPVTPASYGDEVAEHFTNNVHIVGDGLGHSVFSNYCMRGVAEEFLELADPASVDTSCVDAIRGNPFFTTLMGPAP